MNVFLSQTIRLSIFQSQAEIKCNVYFTNEKCKYFYEIRAEISFWEELYKWYFFINPSISFTF